MDLDYLVRTVWGEARNQPPEGQQAVAAVILNRAKQAGQSVADVVTARGQFEPWGNPQTRARLTSLSADSPEYQRIAANIQLTLAGTDPTGGATHFYSPKAQAALGRKPPAWDNGSGVDLGDHRFFKLGYSAPKGGSRVAEAEGFDGADIFGEAASGQRRDAGGFDGSAIFAAKPPPAVPQRPPQRPQAAPAAAPLAPAVRQRGQAEDMGTALASGVQKGISGIADLVQQGPLGTVMGGIQTAANLAGMMQGQGPGRPAAPVTLNAQMAAQNGYKPQSKGARVTETLGTMLPNALIPASAPARLANVVLPTAGNEMGQNVAEAFGFDERGQQIGGAIGAGLGGLAASVRTAPKAVTLPRADVAALETANTAAWKKVDASPYRWSAAETKSLAADVRKIVDDADPDLYEQSAKWVAKIERMAGRGELTLGKLNTLKSQMREQLLGVGSKEVSVGGAMIDRVEALINTAKDPSLAAAREGYKRLSKIRDVTSRVESAELAQETAGTGGNANAVRQKLKPTIDPRSPQRVRNYTPDETRAVRKVVKGTPAQNAMRLATAFDPTAGKLQALLAGGMGVASLGKTLALAPLGMAAKYGEKKIAAKSLEELIDLFASGGVRPQPAPNPSRAYLGGAAVTAPLLTLPATASAKPKQKSRR